MVVRRGSRLRPDGLADWWRIFVGGGEAAVCRYFIRIRGSGRIWWRSSRRSSRRSSYARYFINLGKNRIYVPRKSCRRLPLRSSSLPAECSNTRRDRTGAAIVLPWRRIPQTIDSSTTCNRSTKLRFAMAGCLRRSTSFLRTSRCARFLLPSTTTGFINNSHSKRGLGISQLFLQTPA